MLCYNRYLKYWTSQRHLGNENKVNKSEENLLSLHEDKGCVTLNLISNKLKEWWNNFHLNKLWLMQSSVTSSWRLLTWGQVNEFFLFSFCYWTLWLLLQSMEDIIALPRRELLFLLTVVWREYYFVLQIVLKSSLAFLKVLFPVFSTSSGLMESSPLCLHSL